MAALRWTLIVVTALTGVGWVLLALWADSFRRSFGASPADALVVVLPIAFLALILAALLLPDVKWLQHVTAAAAAAVAVGCILIMGETVFVGSVGLVYIGLWFLHYWQRTWSAPAQPG
jgi:hypothetical protein